MAWSCFIFCIPESEGSFLIASNFGASAFRMGRTSTSCCGVSFSCCAKAITFFSASGDWPGAVGARIRKARRQATDVRSVKSFLMTQCACSVHDSPMGPKSYQEPRDESAHHDIDGVALIKGGAIVNAAGVVTIVTAVGNRAIGPWESAVVAVRKSRRTTIVSAANRHRAAAVSIASADCNAAPTRSDPAVGLATCQKHCRSENNGGEGLT